MMSLLFPVSQFQKKTKALHMCLEAQLHLSFQGYNPIARLTRQKRKNPQPNNNPSKLTNEQQQKPNKQNLKKKKKKKRALQILSTCEAQLNILYKRWHY